MACCARAVVTSEQFFLFWLLRLFVIKLYNGKEGKSLQEFCFIYALHDTDIEKKNQNHKASRKPSHTSVTPKQEVSLFYTYFKEPYNNLGWKEFRSLRRASQSRDSFQFNEVAEDLFQESFEYLQGWQLNNFSR